MARRDLTPTLSQVDQLEPTGWPNRTDTSLSYDDSTRTVTLTVGGSGASFYSGGQRYTLPASSVLTVVHANSTGIHFVYFDQGTTLQSSTTPWTIDTTQVPVTAIYYNATTAQGVFLEERHGIQMDGNTHKYLHFTEGTKVVSGFAISGYTLNPSSPANSDNDFDIASGVIADEDLHSTVPALVAGANAYRVWYRSGASGEWQWDTTSYPFTVGSQYIQFNQFTGGNWVKTEAVSNRYINMWVMTTPALTPNQGIIQIMGQVAHGSLAAAQEEAFNSLLFGELPFTEFAALYRVTFRSSNTYSTVGKVRIEGVTRIVGSTVTINQTSIGSHAALSGLTDPNSHPASAISVETTNFNTKLTTADDTVQKALETLDDAVSGPVVLGTDTDGNYVATITGTTNQVNVAGSGSETANVTLSLPQDIATTSTPAFAAVDLNTQATLAAAAATISVTTPVKFDEWSSSAYRSAEYVLQFTQGANYSMTKLLVIHDGTDASITEYGHVEVGSSIDFVIGTNFAVGNLEITVTCSTANLLPVFMKFSRVLFDA